MPKGICAKTAGKVIKTSPGPAPGWNPKAKTAGKMAKPAMSATMVSNPTTHAVLDGISSWSLR